LGRKSKSELDEGMQPSWDYGSVGHLFYVAFSDEYEQ
jgi:hypothetical protein